MDPVSMYMPYRASLIEVYKGLAAEWGWKMKLPWIPVFGKNKKPKPNPSFC